MNRAWGEPCVRSQFKDRPHYFLSAVCCSGSLSGRAWPRAVLSVSGMANSLLPAPEELFAESSVTFLQIELLRPSWG